MVQRQFQGMENYGQAQLVDDSYGLGMGPVGGDFYT